jgi:hypothetical protein
LLKKLLHAGSIFWFRTGPGQPQQKQKQKQIFAVKVSKGKKSPLGIS